MQQFRSVTVVDLLSEAVGEAQLLVPKVVEGQTQTALAAGVAVFDDDEKKPAIVMAPDMADDIIEAAVARV